MSKFLCALWAVVLLYSPLAAAADSIKIGVVSLDRILREASPAVKAEKKLEKEFAARSDELQNMAKKGKEMQATLEREGVTMSDTDRRNKERELASLNREIQRAQREFREDLNLRRNEELAGVIERANRAIQSIAEAEKFDLILQDAVYKSPRIDITDKVIKALAEK